MGKRSFTPTPLEWKCRQKSFANPPPPPQYLLSTSRFSAKSSQRGSRVPPEITNRTIIVDIERFYEGGGGR